MKGVQKPFQLKEVSISHSTSNSVTQTLKFPLKCTNVLASCTTNIVCNPIGKFAFSQKSFSLYTMFNEDMIESDDSI